MIVKERLEGTAILENVLRDIAEAPVANGITFQLIAKSALEEYAASIVRKPSLTTGKPDVA